MFARASLLICTILIFEMPAILGAAVVRSIPPCTTSAINTPGTSPEGLMWEGTEHQVVGNERSAVPQPAPTPNAPEDRGIVAVGRAPSPAKDAMWVGTDNQNMPQRLRREGDTDKAPRSPMPAPARGAMWKGREHEEAMRGRTEGFEPLTGAMWKNRVHEESIGGKKRGVKRRDSDDNSVMAGAGAMWKNKVHEESKDGKK